MKYQSGSLKATMLTSGFLSILFSAVSVLAHSPLCDCFLNDDESITCEGGFSDGSSAEGIDIRVVDDSGRVLLAGKMDAKSQYTFTAPQEEYHVVFDAGENHSVTIYQEDIE